MSIENPKMNIGEGGVENKHEVFDPVQDFKNAIDRRHQENIKRAEVIAEGLKKFKILEIANRLEFTPGGLIMTDDVEGVARKVYHEGDLERVDFGELMALGDSIQSLLQECKLSNTSDEVAYAEGISVESGLKKAGQIISFLHRYL